MIKNGLTYEQYSEMGGLTHSVLKRINVSPLNLRRYVQEESASMALGSAVHCAVLEPESYCDRYVVFDGATRRGKAWDAFRDENADKTILTRSESGTVDNIVAAVRSNTDAMRLINGAQCEVSFDWQDERHIVNGEPIKRRGRADGITPQDDPRYSCLFDLKTSRDVTIDGFSRIVAQYLYHAQLADYADGLARNGVIVTEAEIIAVQNCEPYDCVVYDLTELLSRGRYLVNEWLTKYCECKQSGLWHGVQGQFGPIRIELPSWADGPVMRSDGTIVEVE